MATAVDRGAVSYPYYPSVIDNAGILWGGSGGPSPDDVPDGTPAEVKKRLLQTVQQGADSLLKFLQAKFLPNPITNPTSATPPRSQVTQVPPGGQADIRITGKPATYTNYGLYALAAVGGLIVLGVMTGRKGHGD